MTVLIIEDEPRAANQLQKLLANCNFSYTLTAILDSIEESVKWFNANPMPSLCFMDIQLADGLCFEIFKKVQVQCPIIFLTAFDQYAIKAFKVNSIDYLLKPVQKEVLEAALQKFNQQKASTLLNSALVDKLLTDLQTPKYRDTILVQSGSNLLPLPITEILYFNSEDSLTLAVTHQKKYIVQDTLEQLVPTLNPALFFQINRGKIIAKNAITLVQKYFNQRLLVNLKIKTDLACIVSRPRVSQFKAWLNS